MARSEREKDALTRDKHAWVGLPIGFETWEESLLKQKKAEPDNVVRLKAKSPYNARVVNFEMKDPSGKRSKSAGESGKKRKHSKSKSSSSGASSGSDREGITSQDSDAGSPLRGRQTSSPNLNRPGGALNEKSFVKELVKYGYDPATMDPVEGRGLARLGTVMYDINTGRQIVHKGNNRWVGTHDERFVVQYELPPSVIAEMEKQALLDDEDDKDSFSTSLAANTFGEYNLSSVKPRIVQHRSGAVTITNPALLNKKSRFLREHRSMFLDNYTHHNLSDYSGLLSSTYFDLTLHAQGIRPPNSFDSVASNVEDDMTDFNFIQSQSPSQSQAPAPPLGFKQSFLTDTGASLAQFKSDSKVFPSFGGPGATTATAAVLGMSTAEGSLLTTGGSAVRFTAAGHPIRGARKPHRESAFPTAAAAGGGALGKSRTKAAAKNYDNISETYRGLAGSAMNNDHLTRHNSKRSTDWTPATSAKTNRTFSVQDGTEGEEGNSWKSSAWGKMKKGAEEMSASVARDPALRNKLYRAATNTSIATRSSAGLLEDGGDEIEDFAAGQWGSHEAATTSGGGGDDDYDSDEEMWRSRSVYRAGKEAIKQAKVWPKKPKINYKLRYTWIPQPLVHNAVNNLYYEKTVWEYRKESSTNNPYDFKKDIRESKDSFQKKVEQSSMLSLVDDSKASSGATRLKPTTATGRASSPLLHDAGSGAKSGLVSPSDASVSSSKYYKNFVGEGTAGLRDGWDTYQSASPGRQVEHGDSEHGVRPGVMITSMLDGDNSSIGSASDGEGTPLSRGFDQTPSRSKPQAGERTERSNSLRQQVLRKGMSFTLRSDDGKSANFDVHSIGGSSVGSNSPGSSPSRASPIRGGKNAAGSVQPSKKDSYFKFPSPAASSANLQSLAHQQGQDVDMDFASGMSSPGPSVSAAGGGGYSGAPSSVPSDAGDAWDVTSASPTRVLLSAKSTSRSGTASRQTAEDKNDEFSLHRSAPYFGTKPAELSTGQHAGAMLVEKSGTSAEGLKVNHYLNKKIREAAHEVPVASDHFVLQPPPPEDSKKTTTHAPKFKFKPTPPTTAPPPDSFAEQDGGGGGRGTSTSQSKKVKLPPERPSTSLSSTFDDDEVEVGEKGSLQKGSSMKRLAKSDSIHPYHFL